MPKQLFSKPRSMTGVPFTYCPGCSHGIIQRLVAELLDEMELRDKTIISGPVGCSAPINRFLDVDVIKGPHGRAPAVATGVKRVCPDRFVLTYQGDGDLAAIGTAEIVHAAARGEKITTIFVNNGIYGMTGGQMAPTTLVGQVTQTTPSGRKASLAGYPVRMTDMLAHLDGVVYLERVAVNNAKNILRTKKALRYAFEIQLAGKGFSMVEVLATCPTNWRLSPVDSNKWLEDNLMAYYPLRRIKDVQEEEKNYEK
jgi:2-oxoglutarate ferredoxin oxidoreductase subunit beta